MLVRSKRLFAALVDADEQRLAASHAKLKVRKLKAELEAERREMQKRTGDQYRALLHKNVIAHVPTADLSIEGILVGVYTDSITLRHASIPMADGTVQQLAGDQIIPRDTVAWLSDPQGSAAPPPPAPANDVRA